jgi:hypothetical protein
MTKTLDPTTDSPTPKDRQNKGLSRLLPERVDRRDTASSSTTSLGCNANARAMFNAGAGRR